MSPTDPPAWHALPIDAVLERLGTSPGGLSPDEAAARLRRFGHNRLPRAPRTGPLRRFLQQFNNILIGVLMLSALVSLGLGHWVDSAVILAVVLLNAAIGFIQEGRAERALEAISGMIDPRAAVLRASRRAGIAADQLVPGDVVLLEAGDRVPADLRLIQARGLRIDEAVLTGESVPVDKGPQPVADGAGLGDRACMAFSGALVAAGQGMGVVIATGGATELGRVSALIGSVTSLTTPLVRQMDGFARTLTMAILALAALTFCLAVFWRGYGVDVAFMSVVGLAVAAIPEGLPAVMSITLALGAQRMAARNAIIRRLPAVETLGSVSVICSDKTGTLTRNEMTVRSLVLAEARLTVEGVGYEPHGAILDGDRPVPADGLLAELARAALLCNDAELVRRNTEWRVEGDPMEGALVAFALKAGLEQEAERLRLPRKDAIPFDAQQRFMATLHHCHEESAEAFFIVIKGAPERVLTMCRWERRAAGDHPLEAATWLARAADLAGSGQRVIALAFRTARPGQQDLTEADLSGDATLLGLVGLIDPPRAEAVAAVAACRSAGIRVVMITGDHAATAEAIAGQLALSDQPHALTGAELARLDANELRRAAAVHSVFARTTPEDKLRLVEALQAEGLTVAMTGDGVNDAPALKRADVGIAMGSKGTEAAKEAAEMVLADDNFASIVAAVREGRTVYDNLMKVIAWTLPTNGGETFTIFVAILFGLTLPITAVQILWVNMITAVALGLPLAFEPPEPGVMSRPPRAAGEPILTAGLIWRVLLVSGLAALATFGVFFWALERGLALEEARTQVVTTLVVLEIFYLFSVRYATSTSLTLAGLCGTPAVWIGTAVCAAAQLLFIYAPPFNWAFESRPLAMADALLILGVGVMFLLLVEAEKAVRLRLSPASPRTLRSARAG